MRHLLRTAAGLAVAASASLSLAQDGVKPPITVRKSQAPVVERETQKVPEAAPAATTAQGEDSRTTRVSNLLGTDLVLEDGNSLGKVSDLIIDNRNGTVAYVIVETDQDYRPIPWKALAMHQGQGQQANDQYFMIGMDRDRFMQSPAISRTEYQTFNTSAPQWRTVAPQVGTFYSGVSTTIPNNFRRNAVTNRDVNQADRKLDQGERKAERKLNK